MPEMKGNKYVFSSLLHCFLEGTFVAFVILFSISNFYEASS